jgi:DNA-binding CsgD family transcriptional regulator
MHGVDDLRRRIASTYNGMQVLRTLIGIASLGLSTVIYPDDFSYPRQHALYFVVFCVLLLTWMIILTLIVRGRLEQANTAEKVGALIRFETRWFSVTLGVLAMFTPMPSRYYVNITWFFSAFLYCLVLANPFITPGLARLTIASPLIGWVLHTAIHSIFLSVPLHLPALLFCMVISAILFYARSYFIHHHLRADIATADLSRGDALSRIKTDAELEFADSMGLSQREREVLGRILRGRITKEIAGDLGVSETTVKTHVKNIFNKTSVRSRLELYALYNQRASLAAESEGR